MLEACENVGDPNIPAPSSSLALLNEWLRLVCLEADLAPLLPATFPAFATLGALSLWAAGPAGTSEGTQGERGEGEGR